MKAKASKKKSNVKKPAPKKAPAKKTIAKKPASQKPLAKKVASKKATPKVAAKKPVAAKPATKTIEKKVAKVVSIAPVAKQQAVTNKSSANKMSGKMVDKTSGAITHAPTPAALADNTGSDKLSAPNAIRKALEEKNKKEMWPGTGETWKRKQHHS